MAILQACSAETAFNNPGDPAVEATVERLSIQMISALGLFDLVSTS